MYYCMYIYIYIYIVRKRGGNSSPLFYSLPPFPPVSILTVIILPLDLKKSRHFWCY